MTRILASLDSDTAIYVYTTSELTTLPVDKLALVGSKEPKLNAEGYTQYSLSNAEYNIFCSINVEDKDRTPFLKLIDGKAGVLIHKIKTYSAEELESAPSLLGGN